MSDGFNAAEKYQSQIPAMQLLVAMGYEPLSQAQLLELRGNRLRNVVLDDILVEKLRELNSFSYRGKDYRFDIEDVHEAIRRLKPTPDRIKGLKGTNQEVYDTLVLGTTITKTIDGDSKSYSFRFIDWENPAKNVFHVSAEVAVERTGSTKTKRCDIVGYVNGIPFLIIENKKPTESLKKADSQLIGYQSEDNIPHLFHFAQLLMSMKRNEARYATVGTPRKFWQAWRDQEDRDDDITALINMPLGQDQLSAIFSGDFASARPFFDELAGHGDRAISEQDRLIYALCRPDRLLDIIRRFTVFDGGVRKVARYQQYFGILDALKRVKNIDVDGRRKGGVVWHTQGSGKSLTMVMLAKALVMEKGDISNPRVIIVTDRDDLDRQIKGTFTSCDMEPVRATSGTNLLEHIRNKKPLITTIINKFDTAARNSSDVDEDHNIFVLVDESHRTQSGKHGGHGLFAGKMRRLLRQACYLGFTGTPLLKKEKNTVKTFGGIIGQPYTIKDAVADGAVVPLLYEGRMVDQEISGNAIDVWFEKISEGLTDQQKLDLKRKYSRMDALAKTAQAIRAKAFDISEHYRKYWQGTGFKAQLVAPSKAAAIRFKEVLDEIGHVSSEIIISGPNENEGNDEVDKESKDLVRKFWSEMMDRYGGEEEYNRQVIENFKGSGDPEIMIVVSKLLTGFDAPRNTVLYVCKSLREHNLLQAIARVNRLYENEDQKIEKEFGHIIDYEGLLGELDQALTTYSAFEGFDDNDVVGTVHDVKEEIKKLGGHHQRLWKHFDPVGNKKDMEAFEQYLADEEKRHSFYDLLSAFGRCLHISLSSEKLLDVYDETKVDEMKRDYKQFTQLKRSVQLRYQETVDIKEFEPKIVKLLDDHVTAMPAEVIIETVNINDEAALKRVVEDTDVSVASRADRIASATRRAITERMAEDPTLYQSFKDLLEETIRSYRERRIQEKEYLDSVVDIATKMARKQRVEDVPKKLQGNEDGQAFFGELKKTFKEGSESKTSDDDLVDIALALIEIVRENHIVDVWRNDVAVNRMKNHIDDYFFDVVRDEKGIDLEIEDIDELEARIMKLARARFPG